MIVQRKRNYNIVRQLEKSLAMYQKSFETYRLTPILNQLQKMGHYYDLDTIDDLLKMYQGVHGAALEIYDILYPPTPEEERQSSKERRLYILKMGII